MEPVIKIFPSVVELADYFTSMISEHLATKEKEEYFSIALSGGSTPKAIFEIISEKYNNKIDWARVAIFWSDERCVPPSDHESNYRMTNKYLFKYLILPELNFCRIQGEDNPDTEAIRYAERVNYMLPHVNNIPQFDLIMLGLGEDGHTASIFPDNIGLFNSDKLFETSKHPVTGQVRITATGKLINNAKEVLFIVTGASKAEQVARIIHHKEGWEKLPASLVNPVDGKLVWLLDQEAAAGLTSAFGK
jgi:6-phosphogluconolactonase